LFALSVKGHSDVTFFSPAGSPGVSDDSVGNTVLGSVSDGGDGVIEVSRFSTVVEDSTGVTLEVVVVSIDGNASWSFGDGTCQGLDVLSDTMVFGSFDNTLGFVILASSGLGNVWVRLFEFHWVGRGICESLSLKTTIATTVAFIAINELGFSELDKFSSLDEVSTLHGSGGGESPAGTT